MQEHPETPGKRDGITADPKPTVEAPPSPKSNTEQSNNKTEQKEETIQQNQDQDAVKDHVATLAAPRPCLGAAEPVRLKYVPLPPPAGRRDPFAGLLLALIGKPFSPSCERMFVEDS